MSVSGTPTIRIGVMCNGRAFPRWQAEAIRAAMSVPGVEIGLLIVKKSELGPSKWSRLADWRHLIWNLFNKGYVERRSVASRRVDLTADLVGVPEVACRTVPVGKFGEALSDDDLAIVREAGLDVIVRFSFGILKGGVLEAAQYGVWSYHHGDERRFRGQPPGFWEIVAGESAMGSILQRITERLDGGTVLERGVFPVYRHSYRRTRDEAFLGTSDFLAGALRRVLSGDLRRVSSAPSTTDAPVMRSPGNLTMLGFLVGQAVRYFGHQFSGVTKSAKWTVGRVEGSIASMESGPLGKVVWVEEQGHTRYLADPFPDPTGKTSIVLVEDFDHVSNRGVISAVDLAGDGLARPVLDPGVHASYPYLFEHEGEIYCTPETYQAGEVRLYRAVSWPDRWEQVATLLRGVEALDPTLIRHDGLWWLFCTMRGPSSNLKLHLYHSVDLGGPYRPHALNPVKTSITGSRPAGTPFLKEGVLHRPSQDCSASYGGSVTINRVLELTPTAFDEEEVYSVDPPGRGRYRQGMHTLSAASDWVTVDGRRDVFVVSGFRRELSARLSKGRSVMN